MGSSGSQPPSTRARAASARLAELGEEGDLESVVEAVVARLLQSGLALSASAEAAAPVVADWEEELGVPSLARQHLWLDELRGQLTTAGRFGVREREEARGLLINDESAGRTGGASGSSSSWRITAGRRLCVTLAVPRWIGSAFG